MEQPLESSTSLAVNRSTDIALADVDEDEERSTCTDEVVRQNESFAIADEETRRVFWSRALVFLVLVAVAVTTSIVVHSYSKGVEEDSFESSFEDIANKVTSEFIGGAGRRLAAVVGFAASITSYAKAHETMEWPNVVMPDFERRSRNVMMLSDVLSVIFLPIVTKDERESWEAFAGDNYWWVQEGLDYQGIDAHDSWNSTNAPVPESIFTTSIDGVVQIPPTDPGPFAPWWQTAPAFPFAQTVVNMNALMLGTRTDAINSVMSNKLPLLTRSFDVSDPDVTAAGRIRTLNTFLEFGGNAATYEAGPVADLYIPVFEDFDNEVVGGEITSYVYWQVYFENILPEGDVGVYVILENTCNQTFSYRIDGSKATYVGAGDHHDTTYDYLGKSTEYGSFIDFERSMDDRIDGQCLYRIRVYPSQTLEDQFLSEDPVRFALMIAGAVLFTSIVFLLYDYLVERRQKLVLSAAVKSSAVVASLFPEEVRARLYQDDTSKRRGSSDVQPAALPNSAEESAHEDGEDPNAIADLYPDCTVQFCDIVGFTTWASSREPRDVFKLLETLYKTFDKSAFRIGVFKVETIGDCYVSAAGLPHPQEDHAVLMARFAAESILRVGRVTERLSETLGEDTSTLGVRIGMHSGPVTAGVLRGAKARFQLFGDTVNTAARMESTGEKAKIHISSTTAALLRDAGFGVWFTEREDEVDVKGKGVLRTFWLKPTIVEESTTASVSER